VSIIYLWEGTDKEHALLQSQVEDMIEEMHGKLSDSLKENHVLREALSKIADPKQCNDWTGDPTKWSSTIAKAALSTPTISGLVVCKDEPIYQIDDPENAWIDVSKEAFDRSFYDKRIVYENSEL